MVPTTYLDSAVESNPIGLTQLDILVVAPDSTLVPVLIVLIGGADGSKWFRSHCFIVAFFCFRASCSDLPLVYSDVPKSIIGTIQSVVPVS